MTPMQAIRRYCVECAHKKLEEITNCTAHNPKLGKITHSDEKGCYLWPYRHGAAQDFDASKGHKKLSRLQSIKRECLNCQGGNSEFVHDCQNSDCYLFKFRFGTDPNQTGKGTLMESSRKASCNAGNGHRFNDQGSGRVKVLPPPRKSILEP
jgi:hypothetical protein